MAAKYREKGVAVYEVPLYAPRRTSEKRKFAQFLFYFWPSVIRLTWIIRSVNADLVHVNTSYNLQGAMAAKLANSPLIWHIREIGENKLADRLIQRLVCLLATHIIAISQAVADTLGRCKHRLSVIRNGIDLSAYENLPTREEARAQLNVHRDMPVVAVIGRLEQWKGQHILVEAAPLVLERFPEARFLLVGGIAANKPEYQAMLNDRCSALGVSHRVMFTGVRTDIPLILGAADMLVLPSVRPEPFGRTIIEAMAAGRPVIATAAGGPLEIVVDGETGFLIPPNDPSSLAQKICFLAAHPAVASTMGHAGRQRAIQAFSLVRLVEEVEFVLASQARM